MITTELYYWHDGVLEKTESLHDGCSHLIVTILNGIPVSAITHIAYSQDQTGSNDPAFK